MSDYAQEEAVQVLKQRLTGTGLISFGAEESLDITTNLAVLAQVPAAADLAVNWLKAYGGRPGFYLGAALLDNYKSVIIAARNPAVQGLIESIMNKRASAQAERTDDYLSEILPCIPTVEVILNTRRGAHIIDQIRNWSDKRVNGDAMLHDLLFPWKAEVRAAVPAFIETVTDEELQEFMRLHTLAHDRSPMDESYVDISFDEFIQRRHQYNAELRPQLENRQPPSEVLKVEDLQFPDVVRRTGPATGAV